MPEYSSRPCNCGSGETHEPLFDGQGIFLSYVCSQCEEEVRKRYNPVIFKFYSQSDVDEPIEEDY